LILQALADLLRADGGLIGEAVLDPAPDADTTLGDRVAGRGPDYPLLVEAIHEGYLLHYAEGRVMRPDDPDLALLAGDRLYAVGLAKLAELGDLEAVRVLADAISRCAQLHVEGRGDEAEAAWLEAATAVAG
jgi:hypothetical protein